MEKIKELIDYGYIVVINKYRDSYYVEIEKQHDVDEFEEYQTPTFGTIEGAIEKAHKHVFL